MKDVFVTLEYDQVLRNLSNFVITDVAKDAVLELPQLYNVEDINVALDTVDEAMFSNNPIKQFVDITMILKRAGISSILTKNDLLQILNVIICGNGIKNAFLEDETKVYLSNFARQILDVDDLHKQLVGVIDEYGDIKDNATVRLKSIRVALLHTNQKLQNKLNSYNRDKEYSNYLQDNVVTIRNGRFVLPIKQEYRSKVEGLLHDTSASGSTYFVEPTAIINLNNELKKLLYDEEQEVQNILRDLTISIANNIAALANNMRVCIAIDVIFAKANYAKYTNSVKPSINSDGIIKLIGARHPLIDSDKVVPIDIDMSDKRLMLISGPNTGGKTITLKTLGLMSIMVSSGLFLPCCHGSHISIFENLYCCLGDEQSLYHNFSTFSSHMLRIKRIIDDANNKSLVLIDELGMGTDPDEGVAIALAVTDYLLDSGCVAVITSHYARLKEYGVLSDRIISASMHFDATTHTPTYQLIIGVAGASNALAICAFLGLNKQVIDKAHQNMSRQAIEYNALLLRTQDTYHKAKEELEKAKENNYKLVEQLSKLTIEEEKLITKQNQIKANATKETDKLVFVTRKRADEIIEQIKDKLMIADEESLLHAKQLRSKLDKIVEFDNNFDINVIQSQALSTIPKKGDRVFIKSIANEGIVKDIDLKGNILINVGVATIKCTMDNLAKIPKTDKKEKAVITKVKDIKGAEINNVAVEIKVIGQTVAEAITNIEPFIEHCHITGRKDIRIVHGKGSGALGKGIQRYLKGVSYIKHYRYGGYGEGEKGVTIVEL